MKGGIPLSLSDAQLRQAIVQLSSETQAQWLLRLARGETQISTTFNQTLFKLIDLPKTDSIQPRTLGQLWATAVKIEQVVEAKAAAKAKAKHVKK